MIRHPEPDRVVPHSAETGTAVWPPYLPHREIDLLMERLDAKDLGAAELDRLLELISREIKRIRSTVLRLTDERLSAARAGAESICSEARQQSERPSPGPGQSS